MNTTLKRTQTILLAGVGGQGTILAADLCARAALATNFDVKVSEIHGMSQRGGSVTTVVRYGSDVASMVCDKGQADYLVAFETTEALRNLDQLRPGGVLIVNDETITPVVLSPSTPMPKDPHTTIKNAGGIMVPATQLAREAGSAKASNVVLLGALSVFLPFEETVWADCIAKRVPQKTIEINQTAFSLGRDFATTLS